MAQLDISDNRGRHHRFPDARILGVRQESISGERPMTLAIIVEAREDEDEVSWYQWVDGSQPDDFAT